MNCKNTQLTTIPKNCKYVDSTIYVPEATTTKPKSEQTACTRRKTKNNHLAPDFLSPSKEQTATAQNAVTHL